MRALGARLTVWLPSVVAVLSFATGVVALATGSGAPGLDSLPGFAGPLAAYVPEVVRRTAAFTGTLTGFLMLVSTYGLRRGYRAAWYATVVLLPVTAVQGVLQTTQFSYPLIALSLVSLPVVLVRRRRFERGIDVSPTQFAAMGALVGSLVYGTVGSYVLRDSFTSVTDLVSAVYFAVVTASTVGYGDITPDGPVAQLFTISYLVIGTASFAVALGTLLGPAIEARFQRALGAMTDTDLSLLENHVIVVGFGDLTEPIIEELHDGGTPFVVITRDAERASMLREHDVRVFVADPSDEEPLDRAGIERARALVAATDDDAQDALAILTARELNPDVRIVAAATDRENTKKLRRAGADTVLSPSVLGGHLLVQSALGERGVEDLATRLLDDDVDR